ncbi:MAG: M23 family metallopeptidase [Ruthenibacterium sp.]
MRKPFNGRNRVTSPYGLRLLYGKQNNHRGIDIVGDDDKIVCATHGGVVHSSTRVFCGITAEWGNYIKIVSQDGTQRFYCHLARRMVRKGQVVRDGQAIGIMGGTGRTNNAYGEHLHYEVRDKNGSTMNPALDIGIVNKCGVYRQETSAPGEKKNIRITANVLRVRSGPGTGYEIETTVKKGQRYTITEIKNGWGKLISGAGWVCLDFTEEV